MHAVGPPTANSDTLATTPGDTLTATPGDTLDTTPGETVSMACEPSSNADDDTSLLDVSGTTLLIQDANAVPHPPQTSDTVPSFTVSNTQRPGFHLTKVLPGGEPASLEADDTYIMQACP